jgi:hypothetical protein
MPHRLLTLATLAVPLLLLGCNTMGTIHKMGPDTYIATARGGAVTGGAAGAESRAMDAAAEYCANVGREILVTNTSTRGSAMGSAEVIFRCLATDDPDYRRPNYQPPPTTVIQDERH